MTPSFPSSFRDHFDDLPDPRIDRTTRHNLLVIVTLAVCAADSWVDVERFGHAKLAWLRTFLSLPNDIPSHDTSGRVVAALDPAAFEPCFQDWTQTRVGTTQDDISALDGKTVWSNRSPSNQNGDARTRIGVQT